MAHLTMQMVSGMDVFAHVCGKRWTLRATIVTIFSNMTKDVFVKCDMIFRLFFGNYHNFIRLNFAK